ncbi:hypothetical protein [Actinoplanes nipponensis]|uniref:hypothetical protein n=1 Tax=Actinoplanes nipponensis TaxID=135950 RepID=UPI0031E52ABA
MPGAQQVGPVGVAHGRGEGGLGEQRRHPLLAAADAQLGRVLLLAPPGGQAELREGGVERGQVAVPLGVGEHAVAVEHQRGHHARPDPPNNRMWRRAMSTTAARWCRNSAGGSHWSRSAAPRRNSRLDFSTSP